MDGSGSALWSDRGDGQEALSAGPSGRVAVVWLRERHAARWRVIGGQVEVTSALGVETAPPDLLPTAPATIAREKLLEMAKGAGRAARPGREDPARFDVRHALSPGRWRPRRT